MEQTSPVAHGRAVPVLHNATLPDGRVVDVHLERGRVREVVPAAGRLAVGDELDLTGHLLLTAPAEPHAHLDKALSFDEIRPPMGDLGAAIAAWERHTPTLTVEGIAERARRAALLLLGNGTTAVRSHVNLLRGDDPLRGIRALVEVERNSPRSWTSRSWPWPRTSPRTRPCTRPWTWAPILSAVIRTEPRIRAETCSDC